MTTSGIACAAPTAATIPGKRSFRLRFNEGRLLAAKDEFGIPYPRKWSSLNTGKGQSNRQTLTFALNEYVNFFLLNKVGVPSPNSHYFHWRVVRGAQEAPDNYNGDFYGFSWAQENYDADFLEAHGLPKGNLYKLINAQRAADPYMDMVNQRRYQGPSAVTNGGDAVRIQNALVNPSTSQTDAWLCANVNYTNWYAYHTILEATRNYDTWPSANKNAAWYFDTNYTAANEYNGRFWTLPWDWTDTWGPTWNAGQDLAWNGIWGPTANIHTNMQRDYRNTMREIRDLLLQPDQINPLIDAVAARLAPIASGRPDALGLCHHAQWRILLQPWHAWPRPVAGPRRLRQRSQRVHVHGRHLRLVDRPTNGFGRRVDYAIGQRGQRQRHPRAADSLLRRPTGLPDELADLRMPAVFGPAGGRQFRGHAVAAGGSAEHQPTARRCPGCCRRWNGIAVWDSGVLPNWTNRITIPGIYVQTNKVYRSRVTAFGQYGPLEQMVRTGAIQRDVRGCDRAPARWLAVFGDHV